MSDLNYKTGEIADNDKVIEIVIEGGMVASVNNIPEGWQYYVNDLDCQKEGIGYTGNALPRLIEEMEEFEHKRFAMQPTNIAKENKENKDE